MLNHAFEGAPQHFGVNRDKSHGAFLITFVRSEWRDHLTSGCFASQAITASAGK
jgi:hypothetical protein